LLQVSHLLATQEAAGCRLLCEQFDQKPLLQGIEPSPLVPPNVLWQ
jgi:hypothetical protein